MSWEDDVRWARVRPQDDGSAPWRQLLFFRAALALSMILNLALLAAVIAMISRITRP